jgi:hypothetical protein
MNWPIWLFVVVGVVLLALTILTRRALYIVLLALTLWLGVEFEVWDWIPWIFWILVILTIPLLLVDLFVPGRSNIARLTAVPALALAFTVVVVDGVTTYVPDWFQDDDTEEVAECVEDVVDTDNCDIVATVPEFANDDDDDSDDSAGSADSDDSDDTDDSNVVVTSTTEVPTQETETVDPRGLPLVSGGNPTQPIVGNPDTQEPVVGEVKDWEDAVLRMIAEQPWYATCTDSRVGVDLEEAKSYAKIESNLDDPVILRFILVVNSSLNDDQVRKALKDEGFEHVDKLGIKRVSEIRNTRRTHVGGDDRCQAFIDQRPQVRISLGIPVFNDKGELVGIADDKGLLGHCGNPWDIPPPPPPATEQTTTTTVAPPPGGTTTTTVPTATTVVVTTTSTTVPTENTHPTLSEECQQNGTGCPEGVTNDVVQPVQDNTTSGVNTGPTPNAPVEPYVPPLGPAPAEGTEAPAPISGGNDSGSDDGSGTPGGTECNNGECDGGGSTPAAPGPAPIVDDGTYVGPMPPPPP